VVNSPYTGSELANGSATVSLKIEAARQGMTNQEKFNFIVHCDNRCQKAYKQKNTLVHEFV